MTGGTGQGSGGAPRVRCDCCRLLVGRPGFAISLPAGGRPRRVCTRCACHVSLKADGDVWMPSACPDAPQPRLRVYHRLDEHATR